MPKNWTGPGRVKAGRKGGKAYAKRTSKRTKRARASAAGKARAASLTPERRSEIARAAAKARYKG